MNPTCFTPASRRRLAFGDRIFIRVILNGVVVLEFKTDRVADMTELIGEVRHAGYGLRGLARLQLRNYSRGWSLERPLMFYPPTIPEHHHMVIEPTAALFKNERDSEHKMFFPWETH